MSDRHILELGGGTTTSHHQHDHQRTIVIGHRNPDTDSAVSACALAWLLKQQGLSDVQPAVTGMLQARTKFVFESCHHEPPPIVTDVRPRIRDMMHDSPPPVREHAPLVEALEIMRRGNHDELPICTEEGVYRGMLSALSLAGRVLGHTDDDDGLLSRKLHTTVSLMCEVLKAECLTTMRPESEDEWNIYVGAMTSDRLGQHLDGSSVDQVCLVVGNRPTMHAKAIEHRYAMMILTGNSTMEDEHIAAAKQQGMCILRCNLDSASVLRRLLFAAPIHSVPWEKLPIVHQDQLASDGHRLCNQLRGELLPVVDDNNRLVGVVDQACFNQKPPYALILVDHNELSQAVEGADQVPIIQIVDHHRLNMPTTPSPIAVRNEVVGSTSTIIATMCRENNLTPPPDIAGLLMAGLITDTMRLRSPTATARDAEILDWLNGLTDLDPEQFERDILDAGSVLNNSTPLDVISADCKTYECAIGKIRVAQVEESGFENLPPRRELIQAELDAVVQREQLVLAALLVTNVVRSKSVMLVAGEDRFIAALPWDKVGDIYDLDDIVSRKKQLLPALLSIAQVVN